MKTRPVPYSLNVLNEIEDSTLSHYEVRAELFWEGTKDHDVSQNIHALLNALPKDKALDILDLGCGPGRDLKVFKDLGHKPVGLDGSRAFCRMAEAYSGCTVLNQSFLSMALEPSSFDGVFANASLFHVPRQELPMVLGYCCEALRPGGVLFCSNPRGNEEGWNGLRYGNYMEFDVSQEYLHQAGFEVVDHYYRPEGKPREEQPWLAIVSRKVA